MQKPLSSQNVTQFYDQLAMLSQIEQDVQVKQFFSALIPFVFNDPLKNIIINVYKHRPYMTNEHLAFLLFSAFQYVSGYAYDCLDDKQLHTAINFNLEKHGSSIQGICLNNNLSTQKISRYAALQTVLSMLGREKTNVIDLGCSSGMGLMALNTDYVRRGVVASQNLKKFLYKQISINYIVGVDTIDAAKDIGWIQACILPENRQERDQIEKDLLWLKENGTEVNVLQADFRLLSQLRSLEPNSFDVAWTSNVLFEIANSEKAAIEILAPTLRYLLRKDGIWVDAYYLAWDQNFGGANNPYAISVRTNRRLDEPTIVLQSKDDNVSNLEPAEGYDEFFETIVENSV